MERTATCCFTGHRPYKLPWGWDESDPRCAALKAELRRRLGLAYGRGYRHFLCGMANGCDFYFCEAVLDLRDERPGVTVEAALPWEGQAEKWPPADRARYRELVGACDFETVVQHGYDRGCMHRRDRYMVDKSGLLLAAYNGGPGGTRYTLAYAMKRGLEVEIVDL